MFSAIVGQWEDASRAAFDFFSKSIVLSTNTPNVTLSEFDAQAWKAPLKSFLDTAMRYSNSERAAIDEAWRTQRDKLDLSGSAASLRDLASINADLFTRVVQANVAGATAFAGAVAQYLENIAQSGTGTDLATAFGQFTTDVQASVKSYATQAATTLAGIEPAWAQWVQTSLSGGTKGAPVSASPLTEVTVVPTLPKKAGS
jgi:hypothetical protein